MPGTRPEGRRNLYILVKHMTDDKEDPFKEKPDGLTFTQRFEHEIKLILVLIALAILAVAMR